MVFLGIIIAILIFTTIVIVHEFGHFKTARFFGVKVEEFGIGIPPRAKILGKDKKGTIYSLNWLPIGGFVRLAGETPTSFNVFDENGKKLKNTLLEKFLQENKKIFDFEKEEITEENKLLIKEKLKENKAKYNLSNKKERQQAIIILAGIFMNFVLAIFIFSILFFVGVKPIGINDKIKTTMDVKLIPTYEQAKNSGFLIKKDGVILYPTKGSLAEKYYIQEGDLIQKITLNQKEINIKTPEDLMKIVKGNAEKEITFNVLRSDKNCNEKQQQCIGGIYINLKVIPSKEGKIGAYLSENIELNKNFVYKYGFFESIKYGTIETYNQSILTFEALGLLGRKMFSPTSNTERTEAIKSMSGPIGMVDFITKTMGEGIIFISIIGAIISINLGVFNLLPIPALDGGRFIFITINGLIKAITGKKVINENIEGLIHVLFFIFLIALSLIIAYNDITKLFN